MKISREWATPLTLGAFLLMAATGVLMFFHLDTGLNKTAHQWLGWLMVAAVAAHAFTNWPALKRHFVVGRTAWFLLGLSALVLAGSFAKLPGQGGARQSPPVLALRAITRAPLQQVAPLAGKPVDQLLAELRQAGIAVRGPDDSLEAVVGASREQQGRAMTVIFGPGGAVPHPD
ncbi:MAG: DUF4405 domain-containing protein [Curvibacter sp.]|nr:DUF4405 domain-containing protein [Curvibacter sp.]